MTDRWLELPWNKNLNEEQAEAWARKNVSEDDFGLVEATAASKGWHAAIEDLLDHYAWMNTIGYYLESGNPDDLGGF